MSSPSEREDDRPQLLGKGEGVAKALPGVRASDHRGLLGRGLDIDPVPVPVESSSQPGGITEQGLAVGSHGSSNRPSPGPGTQRLFLLGQGRPAVFRSIWAAKLAEGQFPKLIQCSVP